MQLKDLHIGTQLRLGLGLICVIVVVFAVLVWLQTDALWLQTRDLYDHPLQVRSAIGSLETDVLALRGGMKSVVLADNDQDIAMVLKDLNLREADALRQFNILYDRYLGPPDDVKMLHDKFVTWNALHEETLRLALNLPKDSEVEAGSLGAEAIGQVQVPRRQDSIFPISS